MSNDEIFDMEKMNKEIAEELTKEREEAEQAEFEPPIISHTQVKGAKYAWMGIAFVIDAATAYALWKILTPYWYYAILWIVVGAGGLVFSEWLWERIGNNETQSKLAKTSKTVSAFAILIMAMITGVVLVVNAAAALWVEGLAVVSVIGLACFHGWQAYQYHEVDDDYIALTLEAKKEAGNQKEIRAIHRAGRRVAAKKKVYVLGSVYQKTHGDAFTAAAGRSFASTSNSTPKVKPKDENPPKAGNES